MSSSSFERPKDSERDRAREAFIAEIKNFKEAELRPGAGTANFVFMEKDADLFDPEALIEVDRVIWEKVKAGTVTREDLKEYKQEVPSLDFELAKKGATMHDIIAGFDVDKRSRFIFFGFIVNRATDVILERERDVAEKDVHAE
jgi:hypothetical protein